MAIPSKSQLVGIATLVTAHMVVRGVLNNKQSTRELDNVQLTNLVKERLTIQLDNKIANSTAISQ